MSELMKSRSFAHCEVCGRLYLEVLAHYVRCMHAPITVEMDGVRLTRDFEGHKPSLCESRPYFKPEDVGKK